MALQDEANAAALARAIRDLLWNWRGEPVEKADFIQAFTFAQYLPAPRDKRAADWVERQWLLFTAREHYFAKGVSHPLYTLGYTGLDVPTLARLVEEKNALLVDIRYKPRSRVAHWNQKELRAAFGERYVWLRYFGNEAYKEGGKVKLQWPEGGAWLTAKMLAERPAILMCACAHHLSCHRSHAAAFIRATYGIEHLELAPTGDAQHEMEL